VGRDTIFLILGYFTWPSEFLQEMEEKSDNWKKRYPSDPVFWRGSERIIWGSSIIGLAAMFASIITAALAISVWALYGPH